MEDSHPHSGIQSGVGLLICLTHLQAAAELRMQCLRTCPARGLEAVAHIQGPVAEPSACRRNPAWAKGEFETENTPIEEIDLKRSF